MKVKSILTIAILSALAGVAMADHHLAAKVYVVHGIPGQALELDPALPVDVAVNGECTLTAFGYGQVAGPLTLPPDTYTIDIGLAHGETPCANPPVISAEVPFAPSEVAVVIAHLASDGTPTASKFTLDYTAAPAAQSRINIHHTAAAPEVDIRLRNNPCESADEILLAGVANGGQGTVVSPAQVQYLSISPALGTDPVIGPLALPVGLSKAYHVFAVGSLDQGSLSLLMFQSPLEVGAALQIVNAQVTVIHGIPGQDLGLPPALPVDISLNGVPALTDFRFADITAPLALAPGAYNIQVGPANADNPGSEAPVIDVDVVLNSADAVTIVAHLSADGAPTAGLFSNAYLGCDQIDSPIFVHHLANAPAVDVIAQRWHSPFLALAGVMSGQQGVFPGEPGEWSLKLVPAGAQEPTVASVDFTVDAQHDPYFYALGSLANNTLTILQNQLPRHQTLEALALALNQSGPYAGALDSLLTAVLNADPAVLQALAGSDPLTVFAPTDHAFEALGLTPETIPDQDPAFLTQVLLTHVVPGALTADQVLSQDALTSLEGSELLQSGGVLTDPQGGQANIIVTDLVAGNGVVHVIDAVLLPGEKCAPSLLDLALQLNAEGTYAGVFDTLIAAVGAADPAIVAALSGDDPLTVFAPTDDAFAALELTPENVADLGQPQLTDILLYHVSAGKQLAAEVLAQSDIPMLKGGSLGQSGGVLTDNLGRMATIIVTDVEAGNGVVHVIDSVVLPAEPLPSLLDLAVQLNTEGSYAGVFDTLIAAVGAADPAIAAALSGNDPLTVFAPTDDAFAALELTPENIADLGQVQLTDILLYHVSAGKQLAAEVLAQSDIPMLKGGSLGQSGGVLTDNLDRTATIIVTDVEAGNGVIHAIDAVVLPMAPQ